MVILPRGSFRHFQVRWAHQIGPQFQLWAVADSSPWNPRGQSLQQNMNKTTRSLSKVSGASHLHFGWGRRAAGFPCPASLICPTLPAHQLWHNGLSQVAPNRIGPRAPNQLVGSEILDLQIYWILLSAGNHQPVRMAFRNFRHRCAFPSLTTQATAWQILGCEAPWASWCEVPCGWYLLISFLLFSNSGESHAIYIERIEQYTVIRCFSVFLWEHHQVT